MIPPRIPIISTIIGIPTMTTRVISSGVTLLLRISSPGRMSEAGRRTKLSRLVPHPENYAIKVDRSQSSNIEQFACYTMLGYFYPYTFSNGTQESLHMDIFVDGSLVEVIVNDRFRLTTWIYPARTDSTGFGLWAQDGPSVKARDMTAWNIEMNVFPERPLNSSSALAWDTPEETNDYVWWTGN
jgi:beta-fructofuranosidase